MFLRNGVVKICSKFTGEHPCRTANSIKLLCNFIEIALRNGCPPVDLPDIFGTPFPMNTSGLLLLDRTNKSRHHPVQTTDVFLIILLTVYFCIGSKYPDRIWGATLMIKGGLHYKSKPVLSRFFFKSISWKNIKYSTHIFSIIY